jgi:hypothetical protein
MIIAPPSMEIVLVTRLSTTESVMVEILPGGTSITDLFTVVTGTVDVVVVCPAGRVF